MVSKAIITKSATAFIEGLTYLSTFIALLTFCEPYKSRLDCMRLACLNLRTHGIGYNCTKIYALSFSSLVLLIIVRRKCINRAK